jgi:hypothetical protein
MLTRNTRLYRTSFTRGTEKTEVYYRDLSTLELSFLSNIKNDTVRYDLAGQTAIYNISPDLVPFGTRSRIGEEVLVKAETLINDPQLLEISVKEFRDNIKKDDVMMCMKYILSVLPGQSFTDLIKLNHKDLIELICLCEEITGKQIFNFGSIGKKRTTLVNPKTLPDDGKSLQQKIDELNSHLGTK